MASRTAITADVPVPPGDRSTDPAPRTVTLRRWASGSLARTRKDDAGDTGDRRVERMDGTLRDVERRGDLGAQPAQVREAG